MPAETTVTQFFEEQISMTSTRRTMVKRIGQVAAACLLALAPAAMAQPGVTALVGGTVVDVQTGREIPDSVVVIEGERIRAVGARSSVAVPSNAKVIPAQGKWIVPGLINMHVHLGLNLPGRLHINNENASENMLRMVENGRLTLAAGVTTVRLTGELYGNDFVAKKVFDAGRFDGPRIATVGQIIVPTGGHGTLEADGPAGFARAVREQIKAGAGWIKFSISGGISDQHGSIAAATMTDEELQVGIDVAHRNGAKVTAHNGSPVAALKAIEYGIDCFEHGYFLNAQVLQKMKEKGVWLVPTAVVSQPGSLEFFRKIGSPDWYLERQRTVGKEHLAMLKQAIRIGVPIALGTDQFPYEPNSGTTATVAEAEIYVQAGMTPLQALQAATSQPAKLLGMEEDVGSIAAGKFADLLVLGGNPARDISALRKIDLVIKGGKVVHRGGELSDSVGG
jgi:imidazolonepropionase-like amidohydrolase